MKYNTVEFLSSSSRYESNNKNHVLPSIIINQKENDVILHKGDIIEIELPIEYPVIWNKSVIRNNDSKQFSIDLLRLKRGYSFKSLIKPFSTIFGSKNKILQLKVIQGAPLDYRQIIENLPIIIKKDKSYIFDFSMDRKFKKYLIEKASILINGVSLTLSKITKKGFQILVIPHTLKLTNLSNLKLSEFVNIEIDILSKYIKNYVNKKK